MNTMDTIILYTSSDEVIITTAIEESKAVKAYFKDTGRDIDDFERSVQDPSSSFSIEFGLRSYITAGI